MPRWEGNSQLRLEEAALALFEERGYDDVSVAEIARRAGLTERSFYRWFSDKREVLFAGDQISAALVDALELRAGDITGLPALLAAFASVGRVLRSREFLARRAAVVSSTPALHERELRKLDALAATLRAALCDGGVDDTEAHLAVDVGMIILRASIQQWIQDDQIDLTRAVADAATRLRGIADDIPT